MADMCLAKLRMFEVAKETAAELGAEQRSLGTAGASKGESA